LRHKELLLHEKQKSLEVISPKVSQFSSCFNQGFYEAQENKQINELRIVLFVVFQDNLSIDVNLLSSMTFLGSTLWKELSYFAFF